MGPDVSQARSSEHRVDYRVNQDVAIAMSVESPRERDRDAAEYQRPPLHQRVNVDADARSRGQALPCETSLARLIKRASATGRSSDVVTLMFS